MTTTSAFPFICDHFQEQSSRDLSQKKKSRYFDKLLLNLAKDNSSLRMDIAGYLKMITELAAHSLNVDRVSAWCYDDKKSKITCADIFIRSKGTHTSGPEIKSKDYPKYFSHLDGERILPIDDVLTDPITTELVETYLKPHNIVSMMDVPLRSGGKIMGILCCEHVGPNHHSWSQAEQNFAIGLTAVTGSALEIAHRRSVERELQRSNAALKKANRELEVARAEAEKANSAKSDFLTHMSHEIRTPLGAILGFIQVLKDTNMSQQDHFEYLTILENNSKKLLAIVNSILDLAKIEANQIDIHKGAFSFKTFMYELFSLLEKAALDKGVRLSLKFEGEIPETIFTDSVRLYQILVNTIGNAIKFTHRGSVDVIVTPFKNRKNVNHLSFKVIDTGIGMTREQQQSLFERFSQADSGVNRKYGGLGIGLLLSQRIARYLGGDVQLISSAPGTGSTFVVTIAIDSMESDSEAQLRKNREDKIDLSHLKILCIDDSKDMQRLIAVYLTSAGVALTLANTGEDGVEKAIAGDPDVVLMDIQMPIMDGYRAVKLLREFGYRKPVIALTAHAMTTEKEKCLASGFTDYLTKPIEKSVLIDKIKEVVAVRANEPPENTYELHS